MVTITVVFVISLQVHHVFNDAYCLNEVLFFFFLKSKTLKENLYTHELYSNAFCKTWKKVHSNHTSSCAQVTEYY